MKISVTDRQGSGILRQFARAIGATIRGRFAYIPKSKGGGYMTGFTWGDDLRMMVRDYYLHEAVVLERFNEPVPGQDNIIFLLSGISASPAPSGMQLAAEQASVFIGVQSVTSVVEMPSDTFFKSVTIAASRQYLRRVFGQVHHPAIAGILEAGASLAFETGISPEIIRVAADIMQQSVPASLEEHYYRLKCEELLCHIIALLLQREAMPISRMHMDDIKAIYAIRYQLQTRLDQPPDIASLARQAGMSEPKMRKLFKQTFGKGVFEYYQSVRMQEAARLLKEKRLTVSEVGYRLGFSNLSHFGRVFEEHFGVKPKKYSMA